MLRHWGGTAWESGKYHRLMRTNGGYVLLARRSPLNWRLPRVVQAQHVARGRCASSALIGPFRTAFLLVGSARLRPRLPPISWSCDEESQSDGEAPWQRTCRSSVANWLFIDRCHMDRSNGRSFCRCQA